MKQFTNSKKLKLIMKKHVNFKDVKFSLDKIANLSGKETTIINGGRIDEYIRPLYGIKIPPILPLYGIKPLDELLLF